MLNNNFLCAIDNNKSVVKEFYEWEDAAKFYYENNKKYEIFLCNKELDGMTFHVSEEQLESVYNQSK